MSDTIETASTHTHSDERLRTCVARLYDAECALHQARQSHIDAWVAAAYDTLHTAIADHLMAVADMQV